jgi:DNA-binding transcriptional regulator YiaG
MNMTNNMNAQQFRALLDRLGLSQTAAARLVGVEPRTARRWASRGPNGMAELIWLLIAANKLSIDDIRRLNPKFNDWPHILFELYQA